MEPYTLRLVSRGKGYKEAMLPHLPKLWLWAPLTVELTLAADDDTQEVISGITEVSLSVNTLDGDRIPIDDPLLIYKTTNVITNADKTKGPHATISLEQGDIMNITEPGDYWIAMHVTAGGQRFIRAGGYITLVDDGFPVTAVDPTLPGVPYLTEGVADGKYLMLDQSPVQTGVSAHAAEIKTALGAASLTGGAAFTGTVTVNGATLATTALANGMPDKLAIRAKMNGDIATGVTIPKGYPVYISSAAGSNKILSGADAVEELTSSKTIGLLLQPLVKNEFGYVITEGDLTEIPVTAGLYEGTLVEGASVWLKEGGGVYFGAPPSSIKHTVFLGVVTRVVGTSTYDMYVKVQNGYELDELHDVQITTASATHVLAYNATSGLWENRKIAAADLGDTAGGVASKFLRGDMTWQTVTSGGGATNLDGLTDVTLSSPTSATQILARNSANTEWVNRTIAPADLGTGTPSASTFLRGDGSWQTVTSGSTNLDGLTDVTITGAPSNGQTLRYDSATSQWKNMSIGTMAEQDSNNVEITGGNIGVNALAVTTLGYADTTGTAGLFGTDNYHSHIEIGRNGPVGAYVGGYGTIGMPGVTIPTPGTIYFGQNAYYNLTTNTWTRPSTNQTNSSLFWIQSGAFYWSSQMSATSGFPGGATLKMWLSNAGELTVSSSVTAPSVKASSTISLEWVSSSVSYSFGLGRNSNTGIIRYSAGASAAELSFPPDLALGESDYIATRTWAGNANNLASGTVATARGGTGTATASAKQVFAGPTSGTAAPSFRQLDLGDLGQSSATTGQVAQWNGFTWVPATVTGSGNVTGPGLATVSHLASFGNTSGTSLVDSGVTATGGIVTAGQIFSTGANGVKGSNGTNDFQGVLELDATSYKPKLVYYSDTDTASLVWPSELAPTNLDPVEEIATKTYSSNGSNIQSGLVSAAYGGTGLSISSGSTGQSIRKTTAGAFEWYTPSTGGSPGGTSGAIQFNNSGAFDGNANTLIDPTTGAISHNRTSLGTTTQFGITLANTTPAAAGAQQVSPALYFRGNGWKTNTTAASIDAGIRVHALPNQGSAAPTASLVFTGWVNGVSTGYSAAINSDGSVSAWAINCYEILTSQSRGIVTATGNHTSYMYGFFGCSNSSSAANQGTIDVKWRRRGANNWANGDDDSASPVSQTLSVQNGSGTNIAGATRYIAGSQGTGTGAGGDIAFTTSPPGSTGTAANALVERFRVKNLGACKFVPLSAAPSTAEAGDVYYDSSTNKLRCYNGSTWNDLF